MSVRRRGWWSAGAVVAAAALVGACGGGDDTPAGGAEGDLAGELEEVTDPEAVGETLDDVGEKLEELEDAVGDIDLEEVAADPEAAGEEILSGFVDEEAWAVVTVGEERFEFDQLYCVTMGGAASAQELGGGNVAFTIDIPPNGEASGEWDPPYILISGDEPYFRYEAGAPGFDGNPTVSVDIASFDGFAGSGTVGFLPPAEWDDQGNPIEQDLVPGTFEFSCPK